MAWRLGLAQHWARALKRAHVPEPEMSARYLAQAATTVQAVRSRRLCRADEEENEA